MCTKYIISRLSLDIIIVSENSLDNTIQNIKIAIATKPVTNKTLKPLFSLGRKLPDSFPRLLTTPTMR